MNVLIVEDETTAYENMVELLARIDSDIHVMGNTESIRQTIKWLVEHDAPDLIFMDIHLSEIACFYTTDKNSYVFLRNGMKYPYNKTLEQIYSTLDPHLFFRANKQFIIARESVTNITIWFDNRLLISLDVETPERVYVSKNKASEFKAWMVS